MTYTGGNIAHWLVDPLGERAVRVLRDFEDGKARMPRPNDFNIAYLIARECLAWDSVMGTVEITDKGRDALDFYREDVKP